MLAFVNDAYWLTLLLSVPAAGFTVRLFIIQHDCGHRSFFRSRRLNDVLGALIGVVTLTPHAYWRRAHNIHHATCGNLRKRGIGDVSVLTVAEYEGRSAWKRMAYRLYRNPLMVMGIGPIYLFVVKYRLPLDLILRHPKLLISAMGTNAAIAGLWVGLGYAFGFVDVLMVHTPVVLLSSAAGVWMFYVQHQFEQTYWREDGEWDFHEASVMASSFYDLPKPLAWLTGHIGLHHIHHLSCRIPNYKLSACLENLPALKTINRIGLGDSLACFRLALWDETAQRLVPFSSLSRAPATP
jgi:omega-6 fatty acid desaturase (delta-12 desaturase)